MLQKPYQNKYNSSSKRYSWTSYNPTLSAGRVGLVQNTNANYIDLSWLKYIFQRLENISSTSTFVYQLIALVLLTIGLMLSFQHFNTFSTTENVILQTKSEITESQDKRIWTNSNSIDFPDAKIDYTFVLSTAEVVDKNSLCSSSLETKSQTEKTTKKDLSNDKESGNCEVKVANTKPTFEIEVKKGENLSTIASKYKTTIDSIVELNNLTSNKLISGQKLIIAK